MIRRFPVWTALLLALAAPLARGGLPPVVNYPSPACNTTLQACIDGVAPGTAIGLVDAVPIDESLTIDRSLSLFATAPGNGVIGTGAASRLISIRDAGPSGGAVTVELAGLTLDNVEIEVWFDEASGHVATIRDTLLERVNTSSAVDGIDVRLDVASSLRVLENTIVASAPMDLRLRPASGLVSVEIVANELTTDVPEEGNSGIEIAHGGAGTIEIDIFSNVIHGLTGCNCGGASGIDLNDATTDTVTTTLNITNNTLHDFPVASDGIRIQDSDLGNATVRIFNNIVTGATQAGIVLPSSTASVTVVHDYNDSFGNDDPDEYGAFPPGPNTFSFDPQYVNAAAGDFRLREGSMAIDAGTAAPPGGLPSISFEGGSRMLGAGVNLGGPETVPEPGAGTAAAAALLAAALLRRGLRRELPKSRKTDS